MAVDVILERGLVHGVADHRAEGAHAVTLLVLLQLVRRDAGEAFAAVTTHQRLEQRQSGGRNGTGSRLYEVCFKVNPKWLNVITELNLVLQITNLWSEGKCVTHPFVLWSCNEEGKSVSTTEGDIYAATWNIGGTSARFCTLQVAHWCSLHVLHASPAHTKLQMLKQQHEFKKYKPPPQSQLIPHLWFHKGAPAAAGRLRCRRQAAGTQSPGGSWGPRCKFCADPGSCLWGSETHSWCVRNVKQWRSEWRRWCCTWFSWASSSFSCVRSLIAPSFWHRVCLQSSTAMFLSASSSVISEICSWKGNVWIFG